MAKKRLRIESHRRRGSSKLVKPHYRTYHTSHKPKPIIIENLLSSFYTQGVALTSGELSRSWKLNLATTKRYLAFLEKSGRIYRKVINEKLYWVKR